MCIWEMVAGQIEYMMQATRDEKEAETRKWNEK